MLHGVSSQEGRRSGPGGSGRVDEVARRYREATLGVECWGALSQQGELAPTCALAVLRDDVTDLCLGRGGGQS